MARPSKIDIKQKKLLIAEVKKYKLIYDQRNPNFLQRDKIAYTWKRIAERLNMTVEKCKKRWQVIRNYYSKLLLNRRGIGSGTKKTWYLAEDVKFLEPYIESRNIMILRSLIQIIHNYAAKPECSNKILSPSPSIQGFSIK